MFRPKKLKTRKQRDNQQRATEILRAIAHDGRFGERIQVDDFRKILIRLGYISRRTHDDWLQFFVVTGAFIPVSRTEEIFALRLPAEIDITVYAEIEEAR